MSYDISTLKKLTIKHPDDTTTLGMLADAYRLKGNMSQAIKTFEKLLEISPNNYQALNNFGTLLRNNGDTDSSIKYLLKANTIFPNSPIILTNLTDSYLGMGRLDLALKACQKATVIDPSFFDAQKSMGEVYNSLGQYNDAIKSYKRALNIQPENSDLIISLAVTHSMSGNPQEAYQLIKPLLKENKSRCASVYFMISKKIDAREDAVNYIISVINKNAKSKNAVQNNAPLYFCLGKHYDEMKSYDKAIENYNLGNKLYNRNFNLKNTKNHFNRIIKTFSDTPQKGISKTKNTSHQPIFILGMPRSGTTLVEQILSSHSDVFGAGELINVDVSINDFKQKNDSTFPETLNSLSSEQLDSIAKKYLDHTAALSNNAKYVTDKMPHNFMHIGMIFRLFPNARIIHCNRHPLDNCLSGYFSNFGNIGHDYSYNLSDLGKYYIEYNRLMSYWYSCYGDKIYKLKYEELVNNQEEASKKIFEYCNLDWDDKYLEFHKNKRTVLTFSHDQVNRPLYSSSMQRWKNYDKHLSKLKIILKDIIERY